MTVLPLRMIGDPVLRTPAAPVRDFGSEVRKLVTDMYRTMDDAGGIGLAAPQVGVGLRLFTYDVDGRRGAVVNPELELSGEPTFTPRCEQQDQRRPQQSAAEGEELVQEGCLSVSGAHGPVRRPQRAVLRGQAPDGSAVEVRASGLLAVCFQHELDHLEGRLFVDRLEGEHRRRALRALRDAERTQPAMGPRAGSSFFGG